MKQAGNIITSQFAFRNKVANAKIISVTSVFSFSAERVYEQSLNKNTYLETSKPTLNLRLNDDYRYSALWQTGVDYELSLKLFGFIDIWGTHHFKLLSADEQALKLTSRERNKRCKIWEHTRSLKKINEAQCECTDEIVLYAGGLTPLLARVLLNVSKQRHQNLEKQLLGRK